MSPLQKVRVQVRHALLPSGPSGWTFCSCGAKTGPLGTKKAQREWHRNHKREVALTQEGEDMQTIEVAYQQFNEMSEGDKYLILLASFTAYVMKTESCSQCTATSRTAEMCALTQLCLQLKPR